MIRQLILDLPARQARGRDDFFVAPPNELAVRTLDTPATWPAGRMMLIGPEGAGKSHLAAIWAQANAATIVPAKALTRTLPQTRSSVIVDDAETVAGNPDREEALFHLYNLMQAEGGHLLLTSCKPPRDWPLELPDLISRMQSMATVRIAPPDDALLSAVLVKLFTDRQTKVPQSLIPWLVGRMDRSFAAAQRLVAALDARAVAEGRPLSRMMAVEVLDSLT